jgi:ABC-2 type transport system permease protein
MSTTTPALPAGRTIRLGASRVVSEVRAYFRQGDSVFFTFLFPVVMLTIFATAFSDQPFGTDAAGDDVSAAAYYLPGMLAAGLLLSGLQNLAIDIPVVSYFIGKIGQVLVTGAAQAALLLLVAGVVFGVDLPDTAEKWATFVWVFLLGVTTSAVLGIALSRVPRSGKSATSVILPITLVLQFISGVYLPFSQLPDWLQNVASFFPLKWMAQGMRSVFLPETFESAEPDGLWNLAGVALATGVWLVVGLIVCRITFRWIRKDS